MQNLAEIQYISMHDASMDIPRDETGNSSSGYDLQFRNLAANVSINWKRSPVLQAPATYLILENLAAPRHSIDRSSKSISSSVW